MHHDVRSILVDGSTAYYLTRYGIYDDYDTETTQDQWFPQGITGYEAVFVESETGPHSVALATSQEYMLLLCKSTVLLNPSILVFDRGC